MKHTLNTINHTIGLLAIIYGILLLIRAAGIADLGGDFTEMANTCLCSVAAGACGVFLRRWQI